VLRLGNEPGKWVVEDLPKGLAEGTWMSKDEVEEKFEDSGFFIGFDNFLNLVNSMPCMYRTCQWVNLGSFSGTDGGLKLVSSPEI
jgi:hypothetical protein